MRNLPAGARRITPEGEHCFFGYYDIPAFDAAEERHLALKTPFMDRLQENGDRAQILSIDLRTGGQTVVGETESWCFQQGCFAQWVPAKPDTVIWNVWRDGHYGSVLKNLATGEEKLLERPVATVDPMGRYALSINFDRLYDFRPGYGYCCRKDPWSDANHPDDDGVWLMDLETGKSRLILSLQQLWDFCGGYFGGVDQKICVNHINFNPDGSRFVFLLRNFAGGNGLWRTATLTANHDGSGLYLLSDFAMASHYYWVDEKVLSIYSSGHELGDQGNQLYELTDLTHEGHAVDPDFFLADGHVSYSPDGEWILYDSYPKQDGCRELYLYDRVTCRGGLLGRYQIVPITILDIRCDLHPVWSPSGKQISFDSVHEGYRGIYVTDMQPAMQALRSQA